MNKRIFLTLGLFFLSSKINCVEPLKEFNEIQTLEIALRTAKGDRRNQILMQINNLENKEKKNQNRIENNLKKISDNFNNNKGKGKENSGAGHPTIFVNKKFPNNK